MDNTPWITGRPAPRLDATPSRPAPLSRRRVQEIRQRMLRGDYDAPAVVESVVRRILERGDLATTC